MRKALQISKESDIAKTVEEQKNVETNSHTRDECTWIQSSGNNVLISNKFEQLYTKIYKIVVKNIVLFSMWCVELINVLYITICQSKKKSHG